MSNTFGFVSEESYIEKMDEHISNEEAYIEKMVSEQTYIEKMDAQNEYISELIESQQTYIEKMDTQNEYISELIESQGRLISEQTYIEKMDAQNRFLAALVESQGGSFKPTSWNNVQTLVRDDFIDKSVNIADQFTMQKSENNLVWDVIGINHDTPSDKKHRNSLTLQLHNCFDTMVQFDAPEAFYYCETGLSAGTYYFVIDSTYGGADNDYSSYQFTLTQAVPVGGQLTFPWDFGLKASTIEVNSFSSATSTTPIEQVGVTEGTSGQGLGTLTEAGDFSNNLNSIGRVRRGSNNYKESAIRQWLNSNKTAGSVWKPQTKFDRPPEWVDTLDGFMYGMDADFLSVIGKTHISVLRSDNLGFDEIDDYFFLPAKSEVYMSGWKGEGEPYPYYSDYSDNPYESSDDPDSNRVKYTFGGVGEWWLRTPASLVNTFEVASVSSTGALRRTLVYESCWVAPACNII